MRAPRASFCNRRYSNRFCRIEFRDLQTLPIVDLRLLCKLFNFALENPQGGYGCYIISHL